MLGGFRLAEKSKAACRKLMKKRRKGPKEEMVY